MKQIVTPVISNNEVMPRTHLVWLESPQIAATARPGQFVMVRCGDECVLPRPFSIHQVNDNGDVSLYFAVLEGGKGTHWLSERKTGDSVQLFGPLGNGFFIESTSRNLLLVAGGMGIAPLYFLAQEASKKGLSVTLLYGTAIENPYPAVSPGIKLVRATENGSVGYHGMVTDLLTEHTDWTDQIFACGPLPMYKTMAQLPELKDRPVQISLEMRMGCGLGACYGCTVKTKSGLKQVCKDGPVFDLSEFPSDFRWDELIL